MQQTEYGVALDAAQHLVTIALRIVDPGQFSLRELIDYEKEERSGGHFVRSLRHDFLKKIDEYVARIADSATSMTDVKEIESQFQREMRDDLLALKDQLKRKRTDRLLSKEFATGVVLGLGE